jgi:anti-sigma factor ChrR (cupin superfamily)
MNAHTVLAQALDPAVLDTLDWQPLRPGVDIAPVYQAAEGTLTAAYLRYQPGARVPEHEHTGHELILVLEGAQSDPRGHYPAGSLIVNPPNSRHAVWSDEGCRVLIVWERPVRFLDSETAD